jgi:mono/diheme cytochrome c family protein
LPQNNKMMGGESMLRISGVMGALLLCGISMGHAQEGAVAAGEALYEEHCATCHGERLRPTGAAPDLKNLASDDRPKFETTVLNGRGQMPAWQGMITDDERAAIWAYIRSRAK